jgi:hypothetical protein
MTGIPDILCSEGLKIAPITDFHMIVISLPAAARLLTSTAGRFCGFTV